LYIENERNIKFSVNNEVISKEDINNKIIKIVIINDILTKEQKNYTINSDDICSFKKINSNCIFIIENNTFITDNFCNQLIDYIDSFTEKPNTNKAKWGNGQNTNCKFGHIEKGMLKDKETGEDFDDIIFKAVGEVIKYLKKNFDLQSKGDSGYCIRKIHGPTRCHKDGITDNGIELYQGIPARRVRNMSLIIALNSDYDGGEFYFPAQDYKVKLKRGQIIAFPPYWTHPHMVTPPTNGTYRYTINTWLYE